jgi:Arm DNA-binding domain
MAGNLTARKVQTAKPGKYSEGALYLVFSPTGSRKWVLRFIWRGKAKETGLGSATAVDLADARERAAHARRRIALGAIPSRSENAPAASPASGCGRRGAGGASAGFRNLKHKAHGQKIGTVPANRMKAGREHRVPLSGRAVSILKQLAQPKTGDFVFPGQARGEPLSNMAMEMMLRRMKIEDATVHGFHSSFRDWAGTCPASRPK